MSPLRTNTVLPESGCNTVEREPPPPHQGRRRSHLKMYSSSGPALPLLLEPPFGILSVLLCLPAGWDGHSGWVGHRLATWGFKLQCGVQLCSSRNKMVEDMAEDTAHGTTVGPQGSK